MVRITRAAVEQRPVGLHGTSYGAINQLFTAAQQPPGLMSAFPVVPMGDAYRDITFSGGELNTSFIPLWLGLVTGSAAAPSSATSDPAEAAHALADHVQGAVNFQGKTVANASVGGSQAYDGPFYQVRSPLNVIDKVRVPTFVVGGE